MVSRGARKEEEKVQRFAVSDAMYDVLFNIRAERLGRRQQIEGGPAWEQRNRKLLSWMRPRNEAAEARGARARRRQVSEDHRGRSSPIAQKQAVRSFQGTNA